MAHNILVTYASRTGSTTGVAEAIGKTLSGSGITVDVRPVSEVGEVSSYQAVVVGSAIQGGQWLPEALDFLQSHRLELSRIPVAVFLVCMTLSMPGAEKYRDHVSAWMAPVRALVRPVSEGLFGGALDIGKIPSFGDRLKWRITAALGIMKSGDHRDWNAIHQWAGALRPRLNQGISSNNA